MPNEIQWGTTMQTDYFSPQDPQAVEKGKGTQLKDNLDSPQLAPKIPTRHQFLGQEFHVLPN